jgi:alpha-glucosidase
MESYMNINHNVVSVQQFPDFVQKWWREGNDFYFKCSKTLLKVSVINDKVVRFRYAPYGKFGRDFSYSFAHLYEGKPKHLEFVEEDEHFIIITACLEIIITKNRMLSKVLDKDGRVLQEDEKGYHWEEHKRYGGEIVMTSKKLQSGEHFFGLGDKPVNMDLRGKRFELWGKDTYGFQKGADPLYKNIPFFMGLHHKIAYGVFFDNSFRSFFDFGCERKNVYSFWAQGGEMNYYFIYGPSLLEVSETYAHMTGTPELPPLWALGYHQCKWSYYPEKVVKHIAKEFRDRKIPCDAIYLDIDYMDGFRCFTWNKEYFPNPKKMVSDLARDGFKTIVIIDPGIKVDPEYSVYKEAVEKDYFCKRMDGPYMKGSVWPGECNFPDFTNPAVRDWWADLFKGLIQEDGIKGIWNDMNEPAVFEVETFPYDVRHDYDGEPCSHRKAHNVYGMQMARATYEGVKKYRYPERPFVITRSCYSGIQRYSSVWTGDNVASWEHLNLANYMCQRLSISGISFAGSDIGGFIETPTGELYIRWIQLGAFHPFFRTHSSGDHGDQEPWSFGKEYEELAKKFIELRYKLLPYMYTTFWQYCKNGTPMLRPLIFVDQDDMETYFRQDEFMVGDNLLVCPVNQEDADGRWLYLPQGKWYYYWDDEAFQGGMEVWAEADLSRIPIFVKAGAVVPHFPVMQYVGQFEVKELTLHAYYHSKLTESQHYEDAGDGYGYDKGDCNLKTFKTSGTEHSFLISQKTEGSFKPSWDTYELVIHGLPFQPKAVEAEGENVVSKFDAEKNVLTVKVKSSFQKLVIA